MKLSAYLTINIWFVFTKYCDSPLFLPQCDQAKDVQFLNLDDIRKNNEKKKNRKKSETSDPENDGLKAARPNRARLVITIFLPCS